MTQCQQGNSSLLVQWCIAEIASCCHPSWYYIMFPLAGWRDVVLCELHHLCLCERQDRVSQETVHSSQQLSSSESFKRTELSSFFCSTIIFSSVSWKCVHDRGWAVWKEGIFWHVNLGWHSPNVLLLSWSSCLCPCYEDSVPLLSFSFNFLCPKYLHWNSSFWLFI